MIRNGFSVENVISLLLSLPVILFALSMHECAHAATADAMGDHTARNLGRLTLNPLKHLDLMGTMMMLLFGFGWAKPVPINSRYFKNPKRGMAISALAGPISNLLFSFICYFLSNLIGVYWLPSFKAVSTGFYLVYALYLLLVVGYQLNLTLAVFNLLPVPPLDGSRILFIFLPERAYFGLMKYERYISFAIMILLFTGVLSVPLNLICNGITKLFSLSVAWMG